MKYKTLFRMLIKTVGVLLTAQAIGQAVHYLAMIVYNLLESRSAGPQSSVYAVFSLIGPTAQLALGAYLFFAGKWVIDKAIPGNRPYCPECGYDLTGARDNRCSECGTPFNPKDVMPANAQSPDTSLEHEQEFSR